MSAFGGHSFFLSVQYLTDITISETVKNKGEHLSENDTRIVVNRNGTWGIE
jgi:hypothetical protein